MASRANVLISGLFSRFAEDSSFPGKGKGQGKSKGRDQKSKSGGNLRLGVYSHHISKVSDRIPSPHKPAKKRLTARSMFIDDEDSAQNRQLSVPPKKKKNSVLNIYSYFKRTVLQSIMSPLCHIDMSSVVNLDTIQANLSDDEIDTLRGTLPSVDSASISSSESFSRTLASGAFQSSLRNYQALLRSGCFDPDLPQNSLKVLEHFNRLRKETDLTRWREEMPVSGSRRTRGLTEMPQELVGALAKINGHQSTKQAIKVEQPNEFKEFTICAKVDADANANVNAYVHVDDCVTHAAPRLPAEDGNQSNHMMLS